MNSRKVLLSTAYLPPISFFSAIVNYHVVYIEKHETYHKQTYRNRCEIYSANGPLSLTIPIVKPNGNRTKICDVKIDYSYKWKKEHWRAIESAYKNSAYFEFIVDYFAPYYEKEWRYLWDFNQSIINTVIKLLELDVKILDTPLYNKEYDDDYNDLRYSISPKIHKPPLPDKSYFQVFNYRYGHIQNLSIFDLLCNCGMDSILYLYNK